LTLSGGVSGVRRSRRRSGAAVGATASGKRARGKRGDECSNGRVSEGSENDRERGGGEKVLRWVDDDIGDDDDDDDDVSTRMRSAAERTEPISADFFSRILLRSN